MGLNIFRSLVQPLTCSECQRESPFFLVYGVLEQNELLLVGTVEKGGRVGVDLTGSGLALG